MDVSKQLATPVQFAIVHQAQKSKNPVAMTRREYRDAVEGTLKPRKAVGAIDQEYLDPKAKGSDGRAIGRPLGITTGLPIGGVWCMVFADNQRGQKEGHWTDKKISEFMRAEFPGRDTSSFDRVHEYRRMYNHGRFTKGKPPRVQSCAFDDKGEPIPLVVRGQYGKQAKHASVVVPSIQVHEKAVAPFDCIKVGPSMEASALQELRLMIGNHRGVRAIAKHFQGREKDARFTTADSVQRLRDDNGGLIGRVNAVETLKRLAKLGTGDFRLGRGKQGKHKTRLVWKIGPRQLFSDAASGSPSVATGLVPAAIVKGDPDASEEQQRINPQSPTNGGFGIENCRFVFRA